MFRMYSWNLETMTVGFLSKGHAHSYKYTSCSCTFALAHKIDLHPKKESIRKKLHHSNHGSKIMTQTMLPEQTCDAVLKDYPLLAARHVLRKRSFPSIFSCQCSTSINCSVQYLWAHLVSPSFLMNCLTMSSDLVAPKLASHIWSYVMLVLG